MRSQRIEKLVPRGSAMRSWKVPDEILRGLELPKLQKYPGRYPGQYPGRTMVSKPCRAFEILSDTEIQETCGVFFLWCQKDIVSRGKFTRNPFNFVIDFARRRQFFLREIILKCDTRILSFVWKNVLVLLKRRTHDVCVFIYIEEAFKVFQGSPSH